ncbi:hypothetical protein SAMN05192558_101268 [Actinokineospora alba]|uniref:Uncharacterized protein n=1 Tax=Actinokineospora alba TaxID=504798 RepID=A0A1H0F863_9PSEU|nr:hypothetical protein [Actinokineospora alba]TDP69378.1 hypothetical protein C8E96_4964 [Actinokineospora alba]SDI17996.1 hypothetical protein SAMN05421871_103602 [Actinokineospora alba]SDN90770.1 hypothetical protein SAMN05192558_101268 [Actinokineospora alba]
MSDSDDTAAEYPAPAATAAEFRELGEDETRKLFTSDDPTVLAALHEWIAQQS